MRCLTGELLFKGDYEQAVIYSILNEEIDLSDLPGRGVPDLFIDILKKTLEKNIENRLKSIGDVVSILTNTKREPVKSHSNTQYIIYGGLAVLIVVLLFWNQFTGERQSPERPETTFTKITFEPGLEDEPSWSPDGKFLAYTTDDKGNFDIVVKPLDGGKPIRIVDHKADDAQASWSPDGSTIAFVSSRNHADHLSIVLGIYTLAQFIYANNGDIFIVPAFGGQQIKVVDNGYYPQWSPDSKMITYQSQNNDKWDIWIKSLDGGDAVQLTDDQDFDFHPSWSNDGKWILYVSLPRGLPPDFIIKVVSVEGGDPIRLLNSDDVILNPRFSKDDKYLIFSSARSGAFNIMKVSIQMDDFRVQDTYHSITISESKDVNLNPGPSGQRIAYTSITNNSDIYEIDLSTGKISAMTSDNASNDWAQLSPDGTKLLFDSDRGGEFSTWIKNLADGEIYGLGTPTARWSPDGSSIIFAQQEGITLKKLGDADQKILVKIANYTGGSAPMISWDNKNVAFRDSGITIYNFENKTSVKLTNNPLDNDPTWSPDDQLIVFQRNEETGRNLYYIDMQGNETQLTSGYSEDSHPFWSPVNPDKILFLRDHKNLFLLSISTGELKQITHYNKANITLDYPSFSFDGKKAYYSLFNKVGDIFILENF